MNKEQGMNPMQCRLALSRNEERSHALTWTSLENTQKWQETVTPFGPARETRGAGQGFSVGVGKGGRISS